MPPLRVLLVSWEYPPVMYGGLGRHVHALSEALSRAGHDVVVLTQAPRGVPVREAGSPGRPAVARAPLPEHFPDVYDDTAAFVRLLQPRLVEAAHPVVASWVPDVVHAHDWVVAEAGRTLAAHSRRPLVATVHATEAGLYHGDVAGPFSRWRHDVERDLVARAAATIVCSAAMADEVTTHLGADPSRVARVPNGVDPTRWVTTPAQRAAARARLGITGEPLLVQVGRLEHEKGAQDAVEALARLDRQPPVHLALVGDGARADDLARQASALGLESRVHLVGRLADHDVAAMSAAADVALVPSRYEPFGLVALEAMAAGTAVVVARTGGLVDIVDDGVTGLVVPPADPSALAEAVGSLLDDPARARALGEAAQQRVVQHFAWAPVAEATARVYADVLD